MYMLAKYSRTTHLLLFFSTLYCTCAMPHFLVLNVFFLLTDFIHVPMSRPIVAFPIGMTQLIDLSMGWYFREHIERAWNIRVIIITRPTWIMWAVSLSFMNDYLIPGGWDRLKSLGTDVWRIVGLESGVISLWLNSSKNKVVSTPNYYFSEIDISVEMWFPPY